MLFTLTQPLKTLDTEEIIAEVGEILTEGAVQYLGEIYGYDSIYAEVNPLPDVTYLGSEPLPYITAVDIVERVGKTDSVLDEVA